MSSPRKENLIRLRTAFLARCRARSAGLRCLNSRARRRTVSLSITSHIPSLAITNLIQYLIHTVNCITAGNKSSSIDYLACCVAFTVRQVRSGWAIHPWGPFRSPMDRVINKDVWPSPAKKAGGPLSSPILIEYILFSKTTPSLLNI